MVSHRSRIHDRDHRDNSDLTESEAVAWCRVERQSGGGHHLPWSLQTCLPPELLRLLRCSSRLLRCPSLLLRQPPADRRRRRPMVPVIRLASFAAAEGGGGPVGAVDGRGVGAGGAIAELFATIA